jgi:hypothetical protein
MTARLPYTLASVRHALNVARKLGLRVTGIRLDGAVLVEESSAGVAPVQALQETVMSPEEIWGNAEA